VKTLDAYDAEITSEISKEQILADAKRAKLAEVYPRFAAVLEALDEVAPNTSELYVGGWTGDPPYTYAHLELHFNERASWADAGAVFELLEEHGCPLEEWISADIPASLSRRYENNDVQIYWQLKEGNPSGCYKRHVMKKMHTHTSEEDVWEIVCPAEAAAVNVIATSETDDDLPF